MKQIKRAAGLLLALVLALTLAMPAWAAGYVPPATCTVHFGGAGDIIPAMLLNDATPDQTERTWEGYRLLDLDVSLKLDAAGQHAHVGGDGTAHTKACYNYSYHVRTDASELNAILVTVANEYKSKVADWKPADGATDKPEVTEANLVQFMEKMSDTEVRDFADKVYRAIKATGTAIAPDEKLAPKTGEFTVTVDHGYWLFADVTKFADTDTDKVNSLVVLETKGLEDVTVKPKVSLPTVDKTASAAENGTQQDNVSVNVGDTVYFTLTGTLPDNFLNYTEYKYVFHDELSAGLTYEDGSVKVYLVKKDGTEPQINGGFTVNYTGSKLTVQFDDLFKVPDVVNAYKATGTGEVKLLVKYRATLNDAALNTSAENNRVSLEYANDPYSTTTGKTPEDVVKVYDFDVVIDKYEKGQEGIKLAGAKFILYKEAADKTKSYYLWNDTDKKVSWVTAEADANNVVTDANGAATFKGLAAGTYYLQETKAPDGYNLVKDPIKVVITKQAADDGVTVQLTRTVGVENSSGTVLPSTGGMGTVIFYVLGAAMVLSAVVLLARRRQPDSSGK